MMPSPPKSPSTESDSDPEPNSLALTVLQNAPDCEPLNMVFTTPPQNDAVGMRLTHAEPLRRSPRMHSAPAAVYGGNAGLRKRKVEEICRRRSSGIESPDRHRVKVSHCPSALRAVLFVLGRSSSPQKMLMSLANDDLGVALSNDSNFHSDAKTGHLSVCKETKLFNNSHGKFFGGKHLRKSPRLNPSSEAHAEKLDVKLNSAMELRRSPRLSSPNANESMEYIVHQEVISTSIELYNSPVDHRSEVKTIFGGTQLRKSPRLNSSIEAYAEKLDVKLNSAMQLRRSPRFSSPNGNENMEIIVHQKKKSTKLISTSVELSNSPVQHSEVKTIIGGMQLRKSPRLNASSEPYAEKLDVKLCDAMEHRISPRLSSSNGNENMEIIVHQKKKNTKVISTSVELSNSPVEQHSEVKTISRSSTCGFDDTKYLRWSSEAVTSSSGGENGRTTSNYFALPELDDNPPTKKSKTSTSSTKDCMDSESIPCFIGDPIPDDEAQKRWGWRYELKDKKCKGQKFKINEGEEDEIIANVKCHYAQAEIGNCIFSLGDCAFIKGEGEQNHVGKIIEFFQTTNGQDYFRVQWFYRIQDTVVQDDGGFHDKRRLFYSSIMNDNSLDCIIGKANVTQITPRVGLKLASISPTDFYYNMEYCVDYSTFRNIQTDNPVKTNELSPPAVLENLLTDASTITETLPHSEFHKTELALLDLFSGCGGMSTGLCLGAKASSVNLVTRWAVDSGRSATESLKLNHPETHVRHESAEDFLELLKEWEKLCKRYNVSDLERILPSRSNCSREKKQLNSEVHDIAEGEFEVSKLVDICFSDPNQTGERGLYLKVHWKGCSPSEDTWEQIKSLSKCKESIRDFVRKGMKSRILPLPGDVDVICGGPPCQGISGYNRFRNSASPLDDERNRQIVIFMDMVKFLKPRYVLMENVVDILRFDKGSLGRYALSRLVHMNYQARLGIIAAGCYGLPQFRLRVFLWGAHPSEFIPQFPLPTHDVIVRYWPPPEFERNVVAYDEGQPRILEKAIVIQDAISDLPSVLNTETRDEMPYQNPPETEFQRYIRSSKYEMTGSKLNGTTEKRPLLYDHRPHFLFEDDYLRVCQIPKCKGANFRDLPGIIVGDDNVARRHPTENPLLPSGKPLVPDYCFTFEQGKSKRPFARLWWDENLPTALTFPSCHSQVVLHPEQDRVLTIREFARLQGFPDYYRFYGTVKERYCQIGNAVAVPVARALGYALGLACRKLSGNEPLLTLPPKFSHSSYLQMSNNQPDNTD